MNRIELLTHLNLTGIGIEIGVQSGVYAEQILEKTDLHLICLDSWRYIDGYHDRANNTTDRHLNLLFATIKRLKEKYENRFTIIREFSEKACDFFKDEYFDFIYLDANHSEEFVSAQLDMWWNKLKYGGIIAGHDYINLKNDINDFGVKNAVDCFCAKRSVQLFQTDEKSFPSWYIKKSLI